MISADSLGGVAADSGVSVDEDVYVDYVVVSDDDVSDDSGMCVDEVAASDDCW